MNISNAFNKYFVNIGPTLASHIDSVKDKDHRFFMDDRVKNSMFINPICENDVLNIVKKFKNKKSRDCEDINMTAIKRLIDVLVIPLTHIYNLSLTQGTFPDMMKIAKVIPVFKAGKKEEFGNYRPISLLPQLSKILEKLFYNKFMSFINNNNILSTSQYGFRKIIPLQMQ